MVVVGCNTSLVEETTGILESPHTLSDLELADYDIAI